MRLICDWWFFWLLVGWEEEGDGNVWYDLNNKFFIHTTRYNNITNK